jgi:hypothetical protein
MTDEVPHSDKHERRADDDARKREHPDESRNTAARVAQQTGTDSLGMDREQ